MRKARITRRTAFATVSALLLMCSGAATAQAATGTVITTNGDTLAVQSGPSLYATTLRWLPQGSSVSFSCFSYGDWVSGPYGSENIWDWLDSGGYVSDAWIYTGSNGSVVPECTASPPPPVNRYPIAWTGIGIYPRASTYMASPKVGAALPDGAAVVVSCETYGETVTDTVGYTSSIWDQLPDGTYIPNAFINTGVNGRTPGVSDCGTPPPTPPPADPPCVFGFRLAGATLLTVDYDKGHSYYGNAYQAVADWNSATFAIHGTIQKGSRGAQISFHDYAGGAKDTRYAYADVIQWANPSNPPSGAYIGIPTNLVTPAHINIYVNRRLMSTLDDAHRTYVLTHEFGHALGLAHSDSCTGSPSIMKAGGANVPSRTDIRIDPYDIATINTLYFSY